MFDRVLALFVASVLLIFCDTVAAQEHDACRQHWRVLDSSLDSVEYEISEAAENEFPTVAEAVKRNGLENARATRNSLFQKIGTAPATRLLNSAILQCLIVDRMRCDYCELVYSRPGWSDEQQNASYIKVMTALSPKPVWRPEDSTVRRRASSDEQDCLQNAYDQSQSRLVAQNVPASQPGANDSVEDDPGVSANPQVAGARKDYLRDPPFYVTVYNRWFVIVGSAPDRETGIAKMQEFKKKAPQYDFALYAPYGHNSSYGIMMASWVPKSIAKEALEDAWRDVTPHRDDDNHNAQNPHPQAAYLWNCKKLGDSC